MHQNLRSFIDLLLREKDLARIEIEVDPHLELAEIHRRVISSGGPALLFTRVKGSRFPVVTNLFGTEKRIEKAFGKKPEKLVRDAVHIAESLLPPKVKELWQHRSTLLQALKFGTRKVGRGPITEVVMEPANLTTLPVITSWQEDGGPFFTLPLVYTEHPVKKKHNLGIYRLQRFDSEKTGMHWQIHKGGGFHYHEAERMGQSLPVTVFLGGPPALILSAIAPLPEDVPELVLASVLADRRIEVVENPKHPHRLLAEAEFAICGEVPPNVRRVEGPFGDHYGYYSLEHEFPVFNAKVIFHRKDAIYPATVVGKPRQEDFFIGDYLQELLSPLFPLVMPGVKDLWSYGETGFHSLAAAVVSERYKREAMVSGFRILGEGQLSLTKFLILTDTPQNLRDFKSLFEHVLARVRWESDLFIFSNLSMDTLDYTSGRINEGSKAILLGLGQPLRELPREFNKELPVGIREAEVFCGGCLVLAGPVYEAESDLAVRIARDERFTDWPLIVLHDNAEFAKNSADFLWATWTRFEPASDIYARESRIERHHISYKGPVVIDARMKPKYPKELLVRDDIARLVDSRWGDYFG
jgi:4-hydroxybenzoate decarboxylase subunit C